VSEPGAFLSIGESKIHFEECGTSAQTLVLLHDGALHSAAWDDVWPEFCKHFHTIRYDRRGYGRSSAASSGYFETDDLAALLRHLKVSCAAILGSSHGGEISINFALDHPDIVQQLVLVGAVVGGMPYSQRFLEQRRGSHHVSRKPAEFSRLVIDFIEQNKNRE
jgi:pimeloyl-ACP methyl ester carboxylesterase